MNWVVDELGIRVLVKLILVVLAVLVVMAVWEFFDCVIKMLNVFTLCHRRTSVIITLMDILTLVCILKHMVVMNFKIRSGNST